MIKKVEIRPNGTKRVYLDFTDSKSQTRQEFLKDCDVNNIMCKFNRQEQSRYLNSAPNVNGVYGDFSEMTQAGLLEATQMVQGAADAFSSLPAKIRDQFKNDPFKLLGWLADPNNMEEAQKLGLTNSKFQEPSPTSESGGDKPKARQKKQQDLPLDPPEE